MPKVETKLAISYTREDVDLIRSQTVYDGWYRMEKLTLRHKLHKGGWSQPMDREVFHCGDAVVVLPYDPEKDHVLLIEQFRPGAYAHGVVTPWMIEAPAGRVEPGERAEDVARRETLEEANVTLERLVHAGDFFQSPGGMAERISYFVGIAELADAGGVHGAAEENEDIRVFAVPLADAVTAVQNGLVTNAPAAFVILWLAANRDRLVGEAV